MCWTDGGSVNLFHFTARSQLFKSGKLYNFILGNEFIQRIKCIYWETCNSLIRWRFILWITQFAHLETKPDFVQAKKFPGALMNNRRDKPSAFTSYKECQFSDVSVTFNISLYVFSSVPGY